MKQIDPKLVRRKWVRARRLKSGLVTLDLIYELWEGYSNARGGGGFKTIRNVYEKQPNGLGKRYKTKHEALKNIPEQLIYKNARILAGNEASNC